MDNMWNLLFLIISDGNIEVWVAVINGSLNTKSYNCNFAQCSLKFVYHERKMWLDSLKNFQQEYLHRA